MIAVIAAVLGALSLLLHAFAPWTKSKLDDRVADAVDRALLEVKAAAVIAASGAVAQDSTTADTLVITKPKEAL